MNVNLKHYFLTAVCIIGIRPMPVPASGSHTSGSHTAQGHYVPGSHKYGSAPATAPSHSTSHSTSSRYSHSSASKSSTHSNNANHMTPGVSSKSSSYGHYYDRSRSSAVRKSNTTKDTKAATITTSRPSSSGQSRPQPGQLQPASPTFVPVAH